jgi:hypothetical protein
MIENAVIDADVRAIIDADTDEDYRYALDLAYDNLSHALAEEHGEAYVEGSYVRELEEAFRRRGYSGGVPNRPSRS